MTKQEKPSFIKVFSLTLLGTVIFAAIFGGIIGLTSRFSFIDAAGFIFIAGWVMLIPAFVWGWIIEPYWWSKLPYKTQEKARNWGIGLILLSIFILYPLGMFGGNTWSGDGQVNLFPESAESKNYRLTADMEVKTKWWWNRDYGISSVEWPDSGTSYFDNCIVTKSNSSCVDDEGRTWRIEVVEEPERPSSDD